MDEQKDLIYQILLTANRLESNLRDLVKMHGLTVQQYQVLKLISEDNELVTHTKLKRAVVQKDADISRLLDRLVKLKLVNKSAVNSDKRKSRIRLSKKGEDLMLELSEIPQRLDQLFDHMDEAELETLTKLLQKTHSEI